MNKIKIEEIETDSYINFEIFVDSKKVGRIILDIVSPEVFKDIVLYEFKNHNNIEEEDRKSKKNLKKFKKITKITENENGIELPILYIEDIKIKKEFQKKGLGTKLLNYTIKYFKKNFKEDKDKINVYICSAKTEDIEKEDLNKIYSKFGFKSPIIETTTIVSFNKLNKLKTVKSSKSKLKNTIEDNYVEIT